jgi:hypothetical protein
VDSFTSAPFCPVAHAEDVRLARRTINNAIVFRIDASFKVSSKSALSRFSLKTSSETKFDNLSFYHHLLPKGIRILPFVPTRI